MLFVMALGDGEIFRHVEQMSRIGMRKVHSTLADKRPFCVVSESAAVAIIAIYLPGLVVSADRGENQLLVRQQFAAETGVGTQFREKESARAAAYMRVGKPVIGEIAG